MHVDFLRAKQRSLRQSEAVARWEERAMTEHRRRKLAEKENEELRNAIFLQRAFVLNLRSMMTNSPVLATELNLHQLLHAYTHLGKDLRSRSRDYQSICTDAKLDLAMKVVLCETESIRFSTPSISSSPIKRTGQKFGATMKGVYAFDTSDTREALSFALAASQDSGKEWPHHTLVDAAFDADSSKRGIHYGASTFRFRSDDSNVELAVESRPFSFCRTTEQYCLMVTDCIDVDDLYPFTSKTSVKQEVAAA